MKIKPEIYAAELVKRGGKTYAVRVATATKKTMEISMMDPNPNSWGTPFFDEVEISEQTEVVNGKVITRTNTYVHQDKKLARMKKNYAFWADVVNWLKRRHPDEFQPADAA